MKKTWTNLGYTNAEEWGLPCPESAHMLAAACASGIQVDRVSEGIFSLYDENTGNKRSGVLAADLPAAIERMKRL